MSHSPPSSPTEIRLRDPLTEVSRKERTALLGVGTLGIIVAKTGFVPSKISALGIDFSVTDQQMLYRALTGVIGYFVVAFMLYAASDFVAWRVAWMNAMRAATKARHERKASESASELHAAVEQELSMQFRNIPYALSSTVSSLRALFDFAVPVVIGVWGMSATLFVHPQTAPAAQAPLPAAIATPAAAPAPAQHKATEP
ncbi:hypothetical protein [Prosthecobacter sp.]|uniref:hypothetical protein n=1 Tax=Prosthecobacter sp. TaxID=1965333 RepID=UPI0037833969